MCGIAGAVSTKSFSIDEGTRREIADAINHRGPDERGEYQDSNCLLISTRLSIIDVDGGHMPIANEDNSLQIVYNGECFNFKELRTDLKKRGYIFHTSSDTEVVLKLYEEYGVDGLEKMNGQYAIAIWNNKERSLFLARDRMGIRPLYYTQVGDKLIFGSEIKAILKTGLVDPQVDMKGLDSLISYACVISPRSFFEGISSVPPGCYLNWRDGKFEVKRYWDVDFPEGNAFENKGVKYFSEQIQDELTKAVKLRLISDVPLGAYLSGGLDSSIIVERMSKLINEDLHTFSITFSEGEYDESQYINRMKNFTGQRHLSVNCSNNDIAASFAKLIYHGEAPLISTESAALMKLSGLASQEVKVVLTGEGADELMGGYVFDRFEKFRRWLYTYPLTAFIPVFKRLFEHKAGEYGKRFFPGKKQIFDAERIFGVYPSRSMEYVFLDIVKQMTYTDEMLSRSESYSKQELVAVDKDKISKMHPFNGSLYLSQKLFLEGHLLASHGDRAAMANSLEGRYPFLDHNVVELFAKIPPSLKMKFFTEKYILRKAFTGKLPKEILWRRKQPFLAPFGTPFITDDAPEMVKELLAPRSLKSKGYFSPQRVESITKRLRYLDAKFANQSDEQIMQLNPEAAERMILGIAITFVISVQMWDETFIQKKGQLS